MIRQFEVRGTRSRGTAEGVSDVRTTNPETSLNNRNRFPVLPGEHGAASVDHS